MLTTPPWKLRPPSDRRRVFAGHATAGTTDNAANSEAVGPSTDATAISANDTTANGEARSGSSGNAVNTTTDFGGGNGGSDPNVPENLRDARQRLRQLIADRQAFLQQISEVFTYIFTNRYDILYVGCRYILL